MRMQEVSLSNCNTSLWNYSRNQVKIYYSWNDLLSFRHIKNKSLEILDPFVDSASLFTLFEWLGNLYI